MQDGASVRRGGIVEITVRHHNTVKPRLRVKRKKEDTVVVVSALLYKPRAQVNVLLASTDTDSL